MGAWFDDNVLSTFSTVSPGAAAIRMLAAMVLAGIIGWERERRLKPAGLRTHILVALAACLFILVSQQFGNMSFGGNAEMRVDPLRLIEAVTAGVAFLAGGVIFTSGGKVRNITTGTSMWMAGAVGLACGAGQTPLAALATGMVVAVLIVLRQVERWADTHDSVRGEGDDDNDSGSDGTDEKEAAGQDRAAAG